MSSIEHSYFNSKYIRTANLFLGKPVNTVKVLVEDLDDVTFWDRLFTRFANFVIFEITPNKGSGKRGKSTLLKFCENLGSNFVICVDSDYHFLLFPFRNKLPHLTETINKINENPYVFQTYAYAIENYKALPICLKQICCRITAIAQQAMGFDFKQCLSDYSEIIYPLFLYRFALMVEGQEDSFSEKEFWDHIRLDKDEYKNLISIDQIFEYLKKDVEHVTKTLSNRYSKIDICHYENELKKLGVFKDNTYLFLRGHDYLAKVASVILQKVIYIYKKRQLEEIKSDRNLEEPVRENRLNQIKNRYRRICYKREIESINEEFDNFLIRKIQYDVEYFLQLMSSG